MSERSAGPLWHRETGDGPIVAVAVHDGHAVRPEIAELLALDDGSRLREEDPSTGVWTTIAPTRVVARNSRFQIDLNRPREEAFYRKPEDAWGLQVWKHDPPPDVIARSLAEHDAFYAHLDELLRDVERRHGRFVILDLHSYNHRREGPDGPPADPAGNPQVNVGTGSMDRRRWEALVERFLSDLRGYDFPGGALDIRENVKFVGRQVPRFVHSTFPETGCCLAVEFKKFFMDEWTGVVDAELHAEITAALRSTIPGMLEELNRT